jgi:pimeloyl-ACP methyl ester carboxylesterase
MQHKNINYKNGTIFYHVSGKGIPVVLLHGFAEDGNVWQAQIDFLQTRFLVIVPDISGSGRSSIANWKDHIGMDDFADSIKAILDEEQITGCVVIGHSMGGYIALAFAEKYPHLLNGLGLFHSSAFADTEEKKQTRLKAIGFIENNGGYTFIKNTTPGLFASAFTKNNPEKINALIEEGKSFAENTLIQYYKAMISRPDRTAVLSYFTKPVLFIIGEQDKAVPLELSLQQCYLPAQSHIYILKNTAHMGMWEEPEKANNALLSFLQAMSQH